MTMMPTNKKPTRIVAMLRGPSPCALVDVLSCAGVDCTVAAAAAAIGNDEQSDEEHGELALGCSVVGWKNAYASGENAIGLSLSSPWDRSSALVMMREERKATISKEAIFGVSSVLCFWCLYRVLLIGGVACNCIEVLKSGSKRMELMMVTLSLCLFLILMRFLLFGHPSKLMRVPLTSHHNNLQLQELLNKLSVCVHFKYNFLHPISYIYIIDISSPMPT